MDMKKILQTKNQMFSSFRIKLMLLALLSIIPLILLMIYFVNKTEWVAQKEIEKSTVRVSNILTKTYEEKINQIESALQWAAESKEVESFDSDGTQKKIDVLVKEISGVLNAGVINLNGTVFYSSLPSEPDVDLSQREYFKEALSRKQLSMGGYQVGYITKSPSVNFGYPIIDAFNEIKGVVYIAFDLNWFNHLFELSDLPKGSSLMILDQNEKVLYSLSQNGGQVKAGTAWHDKRDILNETKTGTFRKAVQEKESYIYGFSQLKNSSGIPKYTVLIGISEKVALSDARGFIAIWWVGICLAALLALMLAAIWGEYFLIRPMSHLDQIVRGMEKGRLYLRVGPPYPSGEMGTLGKSFDKMATTIMEHQQELEKSNKQLIKALGTLKKTQEQLLEKEKMHALGEMASGIAHDFNNSLTTILGFSELLIELCEKNKRDRSKVNYLKSIKTAAEDSAHVVKRLREFYKKSEKETPFQKISINNVIEEVVHLTQPKWKDQCMAQGISIDVLLDLTPGVFIKGNVSELREVFINLMFNAVDAMPDGGQIILETKVVGPFVEVCVRDTGIGMNEEIKKHCLEPFYTSKGKQGTGLGLSSVESIVKHHSGRVHIESEIGKGTTICLQIPKVENRFEEKKSVKMAKKAPPMKLLVIEDEVAVRKVVSYYLRLDGHQVVAVPSAFEALERLKKESFDMIISDSGMPRLSGVNFSEKIKKTYQNTPVILLTGSADYYKDTGQIPESVDMVLSKPVSRDQIRSSILQVLRKRSLNTAA